MIRVLVKLARRVSFACVLRANGASLISTPQINKESPLILLQDDFFVLTLHTYKNVVSVKYFTSLTYICSRKFFFGDSIQNSNNSRSKKLTKVKKNDNIKQLKESNKRMKQINNKVKECNKKIKEISKQKKESNKKVKDVNKNTQEIIRTQSKSKRTWKQIIRKLMKSKRKRRKVIRE